MKGQICGKGDAILIGKCGECLDKIVINTKGIYRTRNDLKVFIYRQDEEKYWRGVYEWKEEILGRWSEDGKVHPDDNGGKSTDHDNDIVGEWEEKE